MNTRIFTVLGILIASTLFAAPVYAQYGVPGVENSITISLSPEHPAPGDHVRATAGSNILDLSKATEIWTVNGRKIASGIGITTVDVTVGALGAETNISVSATVGSVDASAQARIVPAQVDMLFESDSYTPPFYQGRALPSPDTHLRVQAIARFKRPNGSLVPPSAIVYTWRQNNQVVGSASGPGKDFAVLPSPVLYGTDTISVEAHTTDNAFSGSAFFTISSVTPNPVLYKNHPLFGIMFHQALGVQSFIPELEMTFAAIPYFAQAQSPDDRALQYAWRVNNATIASDATSPSEITINAGKTGGRALIELEITHATNIFMNASKSWSVSFSSKSGSLTSPSTKSPFDQTP